MLHLTRHIRLSVLRCRQLNELAQPGGSLYGIQNTNGGRIVIFGGGEPLVVGERIVGGLGVSGGTEDEDTALAAYGRQVFEELVGGTV